VADSFHGGVPDDLSGAGKEGLGKGLCKSDHRTDPLSMAQNCQL
jgi:hypothetical protein